MSASVDIESEHLFRAALRDGINLFTGAGFSRLAASSGGRLPLGFEFEGELRTHFKDMDLPKDVDLSTICTIIKSQRIQEFREFCTERFRVTSYDPLYKSLLKISCRNIFSTNIDDLVHQLVESTSEKYLHDIFLTGPSPADSRSISYFALHGCVNHSKRDFVFGTTEIASAYGDDPQLWNHFAQILSMRPTVFWGYGMRDAGTLTAISSATRSHRASNTRMWVLLSDDEKKNEAYYRALGFLTIYGDTRSLLTYIDSQSPATPIERSPSFSASQFPEYRIPAIGSIPVREAALFFEGSEPSWYDVLQGIPATTSHFQKLENEIASGKSILIQGVPASGKSTLLRMLASTRQNYRSSVIFISGYMEAAKAHLLVEEIGEDHVYIFWDNVFDNTDAVQIIQSLPRAQLILSDRDYIYQFGFHRLDISNLSIYDCSDLSPRDVQSLVAKIPDGILNKRRVREIEKSKDQIAVFDVIQTVTYNANLSDRIRKIFTDLSKEDEIFKELFVLISYFHNARVPASFDAVASYCGLRGYKVLEVSDLLKRLGGLVKEYDGAFGGDDQDYFASRSTIFAEACMEACPPLILRKVISTVLREISIVKIPHYFVFQRGAFRNELFARAFPNWRDGLELYDLMFEVALTDRPRPYIKQQCALYLAQKGKYHDAFAAIDEAVRMSQGRIPTIRHTQARIKFEANIKTDDDDEGYVYASLFDSMRKLEECRQLDTRKLRHSLYFARFALQLDDRYSDEDTLNLVRKAEKWLSEEVGKPGFTRSVARILVDVRARLLAATETA